MKRIFSLAQELRAIRLGGGQKTENGADLMAVPENTELPWQAEVKRLEQAFSEVLQAIARFTGVDVPGAPPDVQEQGGVPQLDWKTLKDRIHDEVEAFSTASAAEMARRAQERGRAAVVSVENEVQAGIDRLVEGFHEKARGRFEAEQAAVDVDFAEECRNRVLEIVQTRTDEFARWVWTVCQGTGTSIPVQIENLLQPHVDEAAAKLTGTFRQQVQEVLAEQGKEAQAKVDSLQNQIAVLEQKADAATKLWEEQISTTAEQVEKTFANKIRDVVEENLGRIQAQFGELEIASQESQHREVDLQMEGFRHRVEELGTEIQIKSIAQISSRIEKIAADVVESSVQHLHQQTGDALEESRNELKAFVQLQAEEVRGQFSGLGRTMYDSLSQDAARLTDTLKGLDQKLMTIEQKHLAISEEELSNLTRTTLDSLAARAKELTASQLEEINKVVRDSQEKAVAQYESRLRETSASQYNDLLQRIHKEAGDAGAKAAAESKATSETMIQELSNKVTSFTSVLRQEALQVSSQIESSLNNSLENYRLQLDQITHAELEEHRKAITETVAGLQSRLKQAAQLLIPGDAKD